MFAVILAAELLGMIAVGWAIRRLRLLPDSFEGGLTAFVTEVSLPCVIFHSMAGSFGSGDKLRNCLVAMVCLVLIFLVQTGAGFLAWRLRGRGGSGRVIRFGLMFSNFTFVGFPFIEMLLGAEGLLYFSVALAPVRLVFYGLNQRLLTPPEQRDRSLTVGRQLLAALRRPCILAVFLGLAWYGFFGLVLPDFDPAGVQPGWLGAALAALAEVADWLITKLASVCSPLGLILCGMTVARPDLGKLLRLRYMPLPLLRCVVLPALALGLVLLAGRLVPMDRTVAAMLVVYAALPVASLSAAFSLRYEPDPEVQFEAAAGVVLSTLLSLVTLPAWYALLSRLFV